MGSLSLLHCWALCFVELLSCSALIRLCFRLTSLSLGHSNQQRSPLFDNRPLAASHVLSGCVRHLFGVGCHLGVRRVARSAEGVLDSSPYDGNVPHQNAQVKEELCMRLLLIHHFTFFSVFCCWALIITLRWVFIWGIFSKFNPFFLRF